MLLTENSLTNWKSSSSCCWVFFEEVEKSVIVIIIIIRKAHLSIFFEIFFLVWFQSHG